MHVKNKHIDQTFKTTGVDSVVESKGDPAAKTAKAHKQAPLRSGFEKTLTTRSGKGCSGVNVRCGDWDGGYQPSGCLSGKEVVSAVNRPFINVHGSFRAESLPLEAMRAAGVPESVLEIFELANQLGAADRPGAGNATTSAQELLKAEPCLSRDQLTALEAAWSLMEIGDVAGVHPSTTLLSLDELVIDRSIRPQPRDLSRVHVSIESLPKSARKDAKWARKVSTGQEDGAITLQDLKCAFEATDKTTPAQRKQYQQGGTLFECVRQLAASKELVSARARVELPALDKTLCQIVDLDGLEIFQKTSTEAGGQLDLHSDWETSIRHGAGSVRSCPQPPPMSSFKFDIERKHTFEIDIPPGHQVIVAPECGHAGPHLVLDGSGVIDNLEAGTYRASVVHEGKIVTEAVFEACSPIGTDVKDLSAYYGHELMTDCAELGVTGGASNFKIEAGGDRPFPDLVNLKHEIPEGRYEGELHWKAYGTKLNFEMDVLSESTLQVSLHNKTLDLIPAKRPTNAKIEGLELPDNFFQARLTNQFPGSTRFPASVIVDPSAQKLYLVADMTNSCHTSTKWIFTRKLQHLATFDLSKARTA